MMLASIVLPRPTSSARMARPPMSRSTRWATSIWWGSSLMALASRVISRSKPGTRAMRSASRRSSYQARSAGGSFSLSANAVRARSSTTQESSGSGLGSGSVTRCLESGGRNIGNRGRRRRPPVGDPRACARGQTELDQLLRRSPVVHAPELDRATAPSIGLDDHEEVLAVLRSEIVLGHLPATRYFALHDEIVSLPVALYLDISGPLDLLGDLPAVAVELQRPAAVGRKRDARIALRDRESDGRLEHELHRLAHPLALLVAHPSPSPSPSPRFATTPAASTKTATTSSHSRVPAAGPAPARPADGAVLRLEHVPGVGPF